MSYNKHTFVYKTIGNLDLNADVYLPSSDPLSKDGYPIILHFHGGGFVVGDRNLHSLEFVEEIIKRNWVYVTFDYRLAPEVKMDELWKDCVDVWNWTLNDAPKLLKTIFDTNKIALVGGSAGGYLALIGGYKLTPRPKVIVDFYGITSITGPYYNKPKEGLDPSIVIPDSIWGQVKDQPICGAHVFDSTGNINPRGLLHIHMVQKGTFLSNIFGLDINKESDTKKISSWIPTQNITADYPPIYILHGDKDSIVPISDSIEVVESLKKHGVIHEFIVAEGQSHGFPLALKPGDPGWDGRPILVFMEKFLQ